MFRRSAGALVVALSSAAILVGSASPASASAVIPTMSVTINYPSPGPNTYHQVCITGYVEGAAIAQWTVTVTGARSDSSQINVLDVFINENAINRCYVIEKFGTTAAAYTVNFEYLGAGLEPPFGVVAVGGWEPVLSDFRFDSGH